ncbi:MAG: hypothetical protein A2Y70_05990 [Candidatus Aminicenantes bacterium RBG_13_64_14]|nr:MAG: hypothetical protein A2Y70_05990 [Candidatus Aminicenantes bacterium RBG_13_64_14]
MLCGAALIVLAAPAGLPGQSRGLIEVVDSLRRTVAIPAKVERIISLEPEITRIIVALGAVETGIKERRRLSSWPPCCRSSFSCCL